MRLWALAVGAVLAGSLGGARVEAAEHFVGGGAHYWRTVDDLADSGFAVEDDGLAYVVSYQYRPEGLFSFEIDVEYFDKGFGGADSETISPQGYLVFGHGWYAAVGAGVVYSSGLEDEVSDPFYAAKVGWELALIPRVYLDINANYRFDAWDELGEANTDTVTLGALVRFRL
jgi:hypothetical protein